MWLPLHLDRNPDQREATRAPLSHADEGLDISQHFQQALSVSSWYPVLESVFWVLQPKALIEVLQHDYLLGDVDGVVRKCSWSYWQKSALILDATDFVPCLQADPWHLSGSLAVGYIHIFALKILSQDVQLLWRPTAAPSQSGRAMHGSCVQTAPLPQLLRQNST